MKKATLKHVLELIRDGEPQSRKTSRWGVEATGEEIRGQPKQERGQFLTPGEIFPINAGALFCFARVSRRSFAFALKARPKILRVSCYDVRAVPA